LVPIYNFGWELPMPERGLLAPLSPHEEVTLRRVALGIANPAELPTRDVERLTALMLVEEHEDALRLTPVGKQRYLAPFQQCRL
jgi:hypothetical protein